MKIIINGWFLAEEKLTGVGRNSIELIKALDALVEPNQIVLLAPEYAVHRLELKNIEVVYKGKLRPILWQNLTLQRYVLAHKGAKCLSMTSNFPILLRKGFAFIYDVSPMVNPSFYSKSFRRKNGLQTKSIIRKKKVKIITISQFSADEIFRLYKRKIEEDGIIGCGWEHMDTIEADTSVFEKYPQLRAKEYLFAMSSVSPNKNFGWVCEAAKNNPQFQYVIAGKIDESLFGEGGLETASNVTYTGYIRDGEAKALMCNAKAFLFPSFYEGFGIPPLEALACSTQAIVSNIPCLKEVFGDGVHYIDPHDANVNFEEILQEEVGAAQPILEKYSWKKSARRLAALLQVKLLVE